MHNIGSNNGVPSEVCFARQYDAVTASSSAEPRDLERENDICRVHSARPTPSSEREFAQEAAFWSQPSKQEKVSGVHHCVDFAAKIYALLRYECTAIKCWHLTYGGMLLFHPKTG